MINIRPMCVGLLMLTSLGALGTASAEKLPESEFKELMWDDLLPADMDLDAIVDSSVVDHSINFENKPMDEVLQSQVLASVVPELDGEPIRIPGFIVPLEFDEERTITEFFLVPYRGACTHMPPPPPNQIIFVKDEEGFKVDDIYDAFWVSGVLSTTLMENDLAASAYTIDMQHVEEYTDW